MPKRKIVEKYSSKERMLEKKDLDEAENYLRE